MRFLLEQKEALEICCQPTSPQKHSKVTYSRGEREWKISRAPNVAAGNDLKKIHKMSRPVMWGVREAAGRFKREGLRAAERCQQSVKENVGELSGCVCEEKACHTDKKNSWRKTKSQSLWNRNRYANSLNAIERMNEWFFFLSAAVLSLLSQMNLSSRIPRSPLLLPPPPIDLWVFRCFLHRK